MATNFRQPTRRHQLIRQAERACVRPRPAAIARLLALAATAMLIIGWQAASADAGTFAVVACKDPATNAAEPTTNWTATWTGTPLPYAGNLDECAQEGNLKSYVGAEINQPSSTGPAWEYSPPEGDEITGGEISAAFSIPGGSNNLTGAAGIAAPKLLFDGADLLEGSPAGGVPGSYEGVYKLTGHTGGHIWMYAFCEPPNSTCLANDSNSWYWAMAEMRWADVLLANDAVPNGTAFSGPLATSTGALSGTQNLTFTAKDEGTGAPGVYLIQATLDGRSVYDSTPGTNGGSCQALSEHRFTGIYEFSSPHPCKTSESVSIPIDTAAVTDGSHELAVSVIDAAGDESIVYTRQITTNNAPVVQSAPTIAGSAQVGSALTGTPGRFTAPEGAGTLTTITGQWLRCTDATAEHCTAIPGATSSTYSPASADRGYYLTYASSASDHDGTTTTNSQPTVAVTEAANGVAGYGSQGNPAAGPGGPGGTGAGGAGGAGGSELSGLTINLTTSNGPLGSNTPWKISLKANRTTVRRGEKIIFTGTVARPTPTTPRPADGNKFYLRARVVATRWTGKGRKRRKHTVYGKWVTFVATHTNSSGQYKVEHKMRLGGSHAYQFVAVAPQETGYRNTVGISAAVIIHERPR